jgi:hypothetical protein
MFTPVEAGTNCTGKGCKGMCQLCSTIFDLVFSRFIVILRLVGSCLKNLAIKRFKNGSRNGNSLLRSKSSDLGRRSQSSTGLSKGTEKRRNNIMNLKWIDTCIVMLLFREPEKNHRLLIAVRAVFYYHNNIQHIQCTYLARNFQKILPSSEPRI